MQHINQGFAKLLLSIAAGVLAAPAMAQTSISFSGLVDNFAGSMRNAGDAGRAAVVNSGGLTTSWIGLKGVEDLGSGLKASFALTSFLRADTGVSGRFTGDTFWSRDANLGLTGSFGAVSIGRDFAPNFLPTILFNPFGDSFNFSPLVLHTQVPLFNATGWSNSIAGDTGWSNEIKYTTPTLFGGLNANLHYQFGETPGSTGRNNVGANLLYFKGPLSLTAFYQNVMVNNPLDTPGLGVITVPGVFPAFKQKVWFAGGAYDFGVAKLFATYDRTSHDVPLEDKTATLGATVPVGSGKILASYAQTRRNAGAAPQIRRSTGALGYDYDLSKRTDVYAIWMNDRITGFDSGNSFGLGMRHRF